MTLRDRLVLHFFPFFAFGGQQKRLGALVRGLGQEYVHRIFAFDGDTSAAELVAGSRASVAALQIEKSKLVSVRNVRKIAALIRSSGADLICTYNFGSIEAFIANRLGPNLPHVHHEDGFGPDEAGGRVDCGVAINPVTASGQIEGGMAQALGYGHCEEFAFDERGSMVNTEFGPYHIYRADEMPDMEVFLVQTMEDSGPFGAKAVAEIPINGPAPAIANAVFHASGGRIRELPLTPDRVLRALQQAKSV